jgi:hypothetical protein
VRLCFRKFEAREYVMAHPHPDRTSDAIRQRPTGIDITPWRTPKLCLHRGSYSATTRSTTQRSDLEATRGGPASLRCRFASPEQRHEHFCKG